MLYVYRAIILYLRSCFSKYLKHKIVQYETVSSVSTYIVLIFRALPNAQLNSFPSVCNSIFRV